ncbi:MAG: Co2+/Mg2+ efflux protein ApaG [Deltaproteobacteria bacterium]|nr:Co2+/Mg2+ efflux protein ApaG [Deltaproteobacteria bacterium]
MSTASDDAPSSETVTQGIRVRVSCAFLPEHSVQDGPEAERRWAFSYTVTITNEGRDAATLLARHWFITDGTGRVEQVRGPGVVGFQPALADGQSFTYTSGAVLRTPHGTMHGTYLMEREDGARFDANIAPFALVTPDYIQ